MIDPLLMHGSLGWNPGSAQGAGLQGQLGLGGMGQAQGSTQQCAPAVARESSAHGERLLVLLAEE